jgi:CRISPR-associated protein Cmr5
MANDKSSDNLGSPHRLQEQDRMISAWQCVLRTNANAAIRKQYLALARSAPADLQTNGLGQMVAFWRAKNKDEHKAIYGHLSDWLIKKLNLKPSDKTAAAQFQLHQWIVQPGTTTDQYMRATCEAQAYLIWLKRFAEAEIVVETNPQEPKP